MMLLVQQHSLDSLTAAMTATLVTALTLKMLEFQCVAREYFLIVSLNFMHS